MQHIEIGMAVLTTACVVWARYHYRRADRRGRHRARGN